MSGVEPAATARRGRRTSMGSSTALALLARLARLKASLGAGG